MSCCGKKKNIIEKYGDVHLHTGPFPLPVNEASAQECSGACYYGKMWPEQKALADSIDRPKPKQLVAINNNPSPCKRYAYIPRQGGDIGVGCMNTRCMCPNCHGDCKCPSLAPGTSPDERLMFNKEVAEPFEIMGVDIPMPFEDDNENFDIDVSDYVNIPEDFTVPGTNVEIDVSDYMKEGFSFTLQDQTTTYLLVGLILFAVWFYFNRK